MMNESEIDRARWELRTAVNKVPAWINSAHVHQVHDWKAARARALKVLAKRTATAGELRAALNSIQ